MDIPSQCHYFIFIRDLESAVRSRYSSFLRSLRACFADRIWNLSNLFLCVIPLRWAFTSLAIAKYRLYSSQFDRIYRIFW